MKTLLQRFRNARLDTKLAMSLVIAGMIGFAALLAALTSIIMPNFDALEAEDAQRHISQTQTAIDDLASRIETSTRDYGKWDDSYFYALAPKAAFHNDVLSVSSLANLDINGMSYARFDGSPIYSRWIDLKEEADSISMREEFDKIVASVAKLPKLRTQPSFSFYARIGGKLAAFGAARITRFDGTGKPVGFVVMARELTSAALTEATSVESRIAMADRKPAPLMAKRPERLDMAVSVKGMNDNRVAQIKFSLRRSLLKLGQSTLLLAMVSSAVVLLFVLLGMRWMVRRIVIAPMRDVEQHMQRVSMSGEPRALNGNWSNDEMGSLVKNLNSMLSQLKDLREQLEIQSFSLGRTESAVGVMHNVRNGLSPVNVIIAGLLKDASTPVADGTERAIEELLNEELDPGRRIRLAQFLKLAIGHEIGRAESRKAEIETARQCLANVVDIIGEQQEAAHQRIDTMPCQVGDIVRQNAALAQYSSAGKVRFSVGDEDAVGTANRVLLSQVVGNIFANAVESITAMKRETGLIEVTFEQSDGDHVLVKIRDNGEGFAPEKGKKLFERGYSSRKEKSGGLGLHWCANAMTLMGGKLGLESDGPGLGATAILTLPAACQPDQEASPDPAHEDMVAPSLAPDIQPATQLLETQNRRRFFGT